MQKKFSQFIFVSFFDKEKNTQMRDYELLPHCHFFNKIPDFFKNASNKILGNLNF
mgnify:CR=1 FL=1